MDKLVTDPMTVVQDYLDVMLSQDLEFLPAVNEELGLSPDWLESFSFSLDSGKAPLKLYRLTDIALGELTKSESTTLLLHLLNLMSDMDDGKTKQMMRECCQTLMAYMTG